MNVHLFVLLQNTVPLPIPTYVRVVPIITDVSVCGQFRNGTWNVDMADGT